MQGSRRFSINAAEVKEVFVLVAKITGGGLAAVLALYLSKLDLGPWDALATPIAIGLGDLARRLLTDTRPEPGPTPWPPPLPPYPPQPPYPTAPLPLPPAEQPQPPSFPKV